MVASQGAEAKTKKPSAAKKTDVVPPDGDSSSSSWGDDPGPVTQCTPFESLPGMFPYQAEAHVDEDFDDESYSDGEDGYFDDEEGSYCSGEEESDKSSIDDFVEEIDSEQLFGEFGEGPTANTNTNNMPVDFEPVDWEVTQDASSYSGSETSEQAASGASSFGDETGDGHASTGKSDDESQSGDDDKSNSSEKNGENVDPWNEQQRNGPEENDKNNENPETWTGSFKATEDEEEDDDQQQEEEEEDENWQEERAKSQKAVLQKLGKSASGKVEETEATNDKHSFFFSSPKAFAKGKKRLLRKKVHHENATTTEESKDMKKRQSKMFHARAPSIRFHPGKIIGSSMAFISGTTHKGAASSKRNENNNDENADSIGPETKTLAPKDNNPPNDDASSIIMADTFQTMQLEMQKLQETVQALQFRMEQMQTALEEQHQKTANSHPLVPSFLIEEELERQFAARIQSVEEGFQQKEEERGDQILKLNKRLDELEKDNQSYRNLLVEQAQKVQDEMEHRLDLKEQQLERKLDLKRKEISQQQDEGSHLDRETKRPLLNRVQTLEEDWKKHQNAINFLLDGYCAHKQKLEKATKEISNLRQDSQSHPKFSSRSPDKVSSSRASCPVITAIVTDMDATSERHDESNAIQNQGLKAVHGGEMDGSNRKVAPVSSHKKARSPKDDPKDDPQRHAQQPIARTSTGRQSRHQKKQQQHRRKAKGKLEDHSSSSNLGNDALLGEGQKLSKRESIESADGK